MLQSTVAARWGEVRRVPGTLVFTTLVVATTLAAWSMPDGALDRLERHVSTNLVNLGSQPLRVLVASALWDGRATWWFLVGFAVVHGLAERLLGTRRWLVVVGSAHVVGTLVSQGLVAWGVARGALPRAMTWTDDFGVSYTMAGAVGLLAWAAPTRWRGWLVTAALACVVAPLLDGVTFTEVGHLVALLVGLAGGFVSRRHVVWPTAPGMSRVGRVRPARAGVEIGVPAADRSQPQPGRRPHATAGRWTYPDPRRVGAPPGTSR